MVTLVLVFLGTSILFSIVAVLIHIPTKSVGVFLFVYGHQNLLFVDFWTIAFLADMKWYLIVALIFISLTISGN